MDHRSSKLGGAGLTERQAALYRRAREVLGSSLPILEDLRPLSAGADAQDVEALRMTVRLTMTQLVSEIAQVGGPRVPRVDLLFELLTGSQPPGEPETIGGLLGSLRERLGLGGPGHVNTVDEEQELTNYRVLIDIVRNLEESWETARSSFDRRDASFEGSRVQRLLSRLGMVQEAAKRTASALDRAGVDRAKRDEMLIELGDQSSLTVTEYLDWVGSFASPEGPRLIRAGGADGVHVIASVAGRLHEIGTRSPLRTLLEAVAAEVADLQEALDQLYQDAFIDTSDGSDDSDSSDDGRDDKG